MHGKTETLANPTVKSIDRHSAEHSPQSSHQDIKWIMDTQVDAAITCQTSIQQQQRSDPFTAKQKREEYTHAKRIGGMTGNEAIESTTIVIDQVYHIGKVWFLRRAEPMEIGLAKAAGKLVAQCHQQGNSNNDEQAIAPIVVPDDSIKQTDKQGNPRGCLGDCHHNAIQEKGRRAIQSNKKLLVPLDNLFYHSCSFNVDLCQD